LKKLVKMASDRPTLFGPSATLFGPTAPPADKATAPTPPAADKPARPSGPKVVSGKFQMKKAPKPAKAEQAGPTVPLARDPQEPVFKHQAGETEMRVLEDSIEENLKKLTPHDATMPLDEFKGVFRSDQSPSPEPQRLNPHFFRTDLPIDDCRKELMKIIKGSQVTIISGTTGSGKSTQLSQFIHADLQKNRIAITQPRRIGAVSLARRVAEEMGQNVGGDVGFVVRFTNKASGRTKMKYITDGCLLREVVSDPDLSSYDCVILDEAHEPSLQTDILFALIKEICMRRPKFKVLVTSATLDVGKFSEYFFNAPTYTIPGKLFDVKLFHSNTEPGFHVDACVEVCLKIHTEYPAEEHILVFLTGRKEIENACKSMEREVITMRDKELRDMPDIVILPAFSALPAEEQQKIFAEAPPNCRKVIFSTNICETSLTVSGIVHVVDSGLVKQKRYNPSTQMDALVVSNISQTQAIQRAGRAGRTKPGCCWRLYTKKAFDNELIPYTEPEIQRTSLTSVILLLKSLNIDDVSKFDFLDRPSPEAVAKSLLQLCILDLIDSDGKITRNGELCKHFPVSPAYAKLLVYCAEKGCLEEALTVTAMHSVENLFYQPKRQPGEEQQSLGLHLNKFGFQTTYGDQIGSLLIYQAWVNAGMPKGEWCKERKLNIQGITTADKIRRQLQDIAESVLTQGRRKGSLKALRKCMAKCFFAQSARRIYTTKGRFTRGENHPVYKLSFPPGSENVHIHPTSLAHGIFPEYIIYSDVMWTTKPFVSGVTAIELKWIEKLLPKLIGLAPPRQETESYRKVEEKFRKNREDLCAGSAEAGGGGTTKKKAKRGPPSKSKLKRASSQSDLDDAKARYLARKRKKR